MHTNLQRPAQMKNIHNKKVLDEMSYMEFKVIHILSSICCTGKNYSSVIFSFNFVKRCMHINKNAFSEQNANLKKKTDTSLDNMKHLLKFRYLQVFKECDPVTVREGIRLP